MSLCNGRGLKSTLYLCLLICFRGASGRHFIGCSSGVGSQWKSELRTACQLMCTQHGMPGPQQITLRVLCSWTRVLTNKLQNIGREMGVINVTLYVCQSLSVVQV